MLFKIILFYYIRYMMLVFIGISEVTFLLGICYLDLKEKQTDILIILLIIWFVFCKYISTYILEIIGNPFFDILMN